MNTSPLVFRCPSSRGPINLAWYGYHGEWVKAGEPALLALLGGLGAAIRAAESAAGGYQVGEGLRDDDVWKVIAGELRVLSAVGGQSLMGAGGKVSPRSDIGSEASYAPNIVLNGGKISSNVTTTNKPNGTLATTPQANATSAGKGTVLYSQNISQQKQMRHIQGTASANKSYLNSLDDAQRVLDAYNSESYRLLSENSKQSTVVIEVQGVTGRYINTGNPNGLPDINKPTNIFMIQSSGSPKIVPVNPDKGGK